jgi:hypothetical protein
MTVRHLRLMADRGTGRDVVVVADIPLRHIRRNAEQAGALFGRQEGSAGHRDLRLMAEGRS